MYCRFYSFHNSTLKSVDVVLVYVVANSKNVNIDIIILILLQYKHTKQCQYF